MAGRLAPVGIPCCRRRNTRIGPLQRDLLIVQTEGAAVHAGHGAAGINAGDGRTLRQQRRTWPQRRSAWTVEVSAGPGAQQPIVARRRAGTRRACRSRTSRRRRLGSRRIDGPAVIGFQKRDLVARAEVGAGAWRTSLSADSSRVALSKYGLATGVAGSLPARSSRQVSSGTAHRDRCRSSRNSDGPHQRDGQVRAQSRRAFNEARGSRADLRAGDLGPFVCVSTRVERVEQRQLRVIET